MQATDRPLSPQERHWLELALATLPAGEYAGGGCWVDCDNDQIKPRDEPLDPDPYLAQLDDLWVVGRCGCAQSDCHTVYFTGYEAKTRGTLVMTSTESGQFLAVGVDRASGRLTELEVIGGGDMQITGGGGQFRIQRQN